MVNHFEASGTLFSRNFLQAHEAPLSDVSDGGDCEGAAVRSRGRNSAVTATGAVQMEHTDLSSYLMDIYVVHKEPQSSSDGVK